MRTFINRLSDVLLPFVLSVPFPIGCIAHISICTNVKQPVYVTSAVGGKGVLMLSVAAGNGLHCSFVYKDNLTIQSTDLFGMCGVLTLAHTPVLSFSCTGRWQLHRRYIQVTRAIPGYSFLQVNGTEYTVPKQLNILFSGVVDVLGSTVSRQDRLIFDVPQYSTNYVKYVNNNSVLELVLHSSDSALQISLPVVDKNIVTVYLNSTDAFPTCEG